MLSCIMQCCECSCRMYVIRCFVCDFSFSIVFFFSLSLVYPSSSSYMIVVRVGLTQVPRLNVLPCLRLKCPGQRRRPLTPRFPSGVWGRS